jgi:histidine ammonia-lyase
MNTQLIGPEHWHISDIPLLLKSQIQLNDTAIANITNCRNYLDKKMQDPNAVYYGINTGFGSLCNVKIAPDAIEQLQHNLVVSHACGTGNDVPKQIVKLMLLLKIKNFTYGNSGVRLLLVQRLVDMYNADMLPVVFTQGSLGASGDLAPLAHLSLPLIGEGGVYYNNQRMPAEKAIKQIGWQALTLKSKEGLALLNGTQFMNAYALYLILQSQKLLQWANTISAISLDAWQCLSNAFDSKVQTIRKHQGQIEVAKHINQLLNGSELQLQSKQQVQDPYSFRCIPQVHGASSDSINYISTVVTNEMNAVTDNPLIFPEQDQIISGGNFHGQPLALALDFLKIALAELGSISERRTYLLISGQRNLPPYLITSAGLDSGLMIPQYTAASIVSANKQLCTPASVDSIVSSNGQEDHVSMGANAAVQAYQVLENCERILGIELLNATQALELRRPLKTSPYLENLMRDYRKNVAFLQKDRWLSLDIESSVVFIKDYNLKPL